MIYSPQALFEIFCIQLILMTSIQSLPKPLNPPITLVRRLLSHRYMGHSEEKGGKTPTTQYIGGDNITGKFLVGC